MFDFKGYLYRSYRRDEFFIIYKCIVMFCVFMWFSEGDVFGLRD